MNFNLNKQHRDLIVSMGEEYLSILAILYGDQIDSGIKRISYYGDMTMLEAENELRVRTKMMRGQRLRMKRELKAEHEAQEAALLEQLKKSHQPSSS
jgi:hypothetical protein